MHDAGKIVPGLVIFLVLVTFPVWFHQVSGKDTKPPVIDKPKGEEICVRDVDFMRREHMQLLNQWRDEVVRNDDRFFDLADGRRMEKSLTRTCLKCHADKAATCDRCHDYVGVDPYCWDCHVDPKGGGK